MDVLEDLTKVPPSGLNAKIKTTNLVELIYANRSALNQLSASGARATFKWPTIPAAAETWPNWTDFRI